MCEETSLEADIVNVWQNEFFGRRWERGKANTRSRRRQKTKSPRFLSRRSTSLQKRARCFLLCIYIHTPMCMYVLIFVYMYVYSYRIYVYIYIFPDVFWCVYKYICIHTCIYVSTYVCMCVCVCIYIYIYIYLCKERAFCAQYPPVSLSPCIYIYIYICIFSYTYV